MFTSTWWRVRAPNFSPLRQHGDEVRARAPEAVLDHGLHVLDHAAHPLGQGPQPVGLSPVEVEELVGELAQVLAILGRNAHHLRDHPHRQRRREVGQHVHPPPRLRLVQELRHRLPDEGPPRLHGPGREVPVHDLPHRQVLGAVVLDELVGAELPDVADQAQVGGIDRRVRRPRVVPDDGRREELVVPDHPHDVVVARHDPQLVPIVPVHRIQLAEAGVVAVGIRDGGRGEHVVELRSDHAAVLVTGGARSRSRRAHANPYRAIVATGSALNKTAARRRTDGGPAGVEARRSFVPETAPRAQFA